MKRTPINKISAKQKAKNARELPIKIEIIKRANGHCEGRLESGERCNRSSSPMYPLSVHHIKKRSQGGELKTKEDGLALCIICHAKAEGINAKFSEPQWSKGK